MAEQRALLVLASILEEVKRMSNTPVRKLCAHGLCGSRHFHSEQIESCMEWRLNFVSLVSLSSAPWRC